MRDLVFFDDMSGIGDRPHMIRVARVGGSMQTIDLDCSGETHGCGVSRKTSEFQCEGVR